MTAKLKCSCIQELSRFVRCAGVAGKWEFHAAGNYWKFRCAEGGIINCWPSRGTINFQGKPEAASSLQRRLLAFARTGFGQTFGVTVSVPTVSHHRNQES